MTTVRFDALEYHADRTFAPAAYRFAGDERSGWRIERGGRPLLELGPGYRLLRVRQCGVCATDLARHWLPFPLPQVIGHEVLAVDDAGRRFVVEINASHRARAVPHDCAFCRAGLPTHCPERTTLGIDTLPGGFGQWILAPVEACIEVPPVLPDATAVLVEPFAAALHAVQTVAPRAGDTVAVLGPRRLGMLVIAALAAVRAGRGAAGAGGFAVAAVVRRPELGALARELGADTVHAPDEPGLRLRFDVVVDTTGAPDGLEAAVAMARREVHVKSTHGRPAGGLRHLTELVVDELAIAPLQPDMLPRPLPGSAPLRLAWLAAGEPPGWLGARADVRRGTPSQLAAHWAAAGGGLPRADVAVADCAAMVDAAIRPGDPAAASLLRPRGTVLLAPSAGVAGSPLLAAIATRALRLGSSRCGDFRQALALLAATPGLHRLGDRLVTHRFGAHDLARAFATAAAPACVKAVVVHDGPATGSAPAHGQPNPPSTVNTWPVT